jgi:multidrug efflux system membrane fusion protein
MSRARVVAAIGEQQVARLHEGDAIPVDVAGERLSGRVEAVLPSGDPVARGFRVHVLIDNPPRTLPSGMTAALRLPAASADSTEAVLIVPANAIVRRGQLTGVFVVEAEKARLRWITAGEPEAESVAVLSGLRRGERVVLGAERERLTDGQPVIVARAEGV